MARHLRGRAKQSHGSAGGIDGNDQSDLVAPIVNPAIGAAYRSAWRTGS
jgi:hypothetical protein